MRKIFTLAAAVLATMAMSATTIFSYTLTGPGADGTTYDAEGGTAKCVKTMASGGSNEITIGDQTFYKFNSSSAWEFTLADEGVFAEGDVVSITAACGTSNKSGKGVKLNGISVTGDFPASTANTITYTVQAGDAIVGQTTIRVERNDSDIKFGSIAVDREGATPSTDPVESAAISGENACSLGGSVELTCNAPKATVYQWSMNGAEIEGATAKKYTFAPTAAGTYSFTCAASNQYNNTPVVADAFVVTITDPADACGELIKAVLNGGTSATMSGAIGGTFDTNLGSGKYKLDKNKYIGIKLAAGTFQEGDVVTIAMSVAGQNYPCLFADKDRKTCLFLATEVSEALEYEITLPEEADGLTALYLSRGDESDGYKWNPTVSSISVNRSCEASDNNKIKSLTINGEAVEAVEGVYSYTVGASVNLAAAEVVYTLAHPKATATPASGFMVNVPNAGDPANTQVITVVAENGSEATYTVSVAKSAALSTDATLSALTVDGYTLDPAFAADVYAYTITKAYGAADPEVSIINATPNDANAKALISYADGTFTIEVKAEDGESTLTYSIIILEAAAKKALLKAEFSNGVHGFIANGNINVPYIAGQTEPTFVSAEFWEAEGYPTAEMVEGKLVVTGIDGKKDEYTITYVPLTPMETSYDEITFTEVPSYIYSIYGWAEDKGVKFSKDIEEASNHRISEGKDRIYIALPVAKEVILTGGSAGARSVVITVNGVKSDVTSTPKKDETITIPLAATEGANLVAIESNGNNGDAGFTKIQLVEGVPTALENVDASVKAVKVIQNGQLFIKKGDKLYNALGTIVK